ncbi:MAG: c-type cytochrome [Burkholderiales bacterium]|nr:MAG: c-type cytochrome [Burkholderiales bacterium]
MPRRLLRSLALAGPLALALAALALPGLTARPGPQAAPELGPLGPARASNTLDPAPAREGTESAAIALGRAVYNFRCYFCHGYSGDARTVAASYLSPAPRDFTAPVAAGMARGTIVEALRGGRPGTAMASFAGILDEREMAAVAAFVLSEFVRRGERNTTYHTAANGWPNHQRHAAAFPFVRGEIALDLPVEQLDASQAAGRRLFVSACITCHEPRATEDDLLFEARAVSYPPDGHDCVSCHDRVRRADGTPPGPKRISYHGRSVPLEVALAERAGLDAASPQAPDGAASGFYARHDVPVALATEDPVVNHGQALYLRNCAFCHAADGTARNWIGRFLEPHPRDLTDPEFMRHTSRAALAQRIRDGIPGTSMSAWGHVLSESEIEAIVAYIDVAFHPLPDRAAAEAQR